MRALEPELAADLDDKAIAHEVPHWIRRSQGPAFVHLDKVATAGGKPWPAWRTSAVPALAGCFTSMARLKPARDW